MSKKNPTRDQQYHEGGGNSTEDALLTQGEVISFLFECVGKIASGEVPLSEVRSFAHRTAVGAHAIVSPDLEHAPQNNWNPKTAGDVFKTLAKPPQARPARFASMSTAPRPAPATQPYIPGDFTRAMFKAFWGL